MAVIGPSSRRSARPCWRRYALTKKVRDLRIMQTEINWQTCNKWLLDWVEVGRIRWVEEHQAASSLNERGKSFVVTNPGVGKHEDRAFVTVRIYLRKLEMTRHHWSIEGKIRRTTCSWTNSKNSLELNLESEISAAIHPSTESAATSVHVSAYKDIFQLSLIPRVGKSITKSSPASASLHCCSNTSSLSCAILRRISRVRPSSIKFIWRAGTEIAIYQDRGRGLQLECRQCGKRWAQHEWAEF